MGEDFRARNPALAEAEPGSLGPSGFDPARWAFGGWMPTSDDPLVTEAFAWADATGVGRGSGAFGYFVRAYVAGASRNAPTLPLREHILMVLGGVRDDMPVDDVAAVQRFANARGIEAGTDETLQAAQPEGREPGGEAMRPNPTSQDR